MPPEISPDVDRTQIRRLLLGRGMIALYIVIALAWIAMTALGNGGLLGQVLADEPGRLTPAGPEVEATAVPAGGQTGKLTTLVAPESTSLQKASPRPEVTPAATSGGRGFGDLIRTRTP